MAIWIDAFAATFDLILKLGSVMFISLFGIEFFMQMGLMGRLKPLGKPVTRLAGLPAESAVCFLTGIGSMIAAHTTAANFHQDKRLSDRQLVLTGVLNTVPFHFKETLTFQLPVVLPLLGLKLCLIYIAAFWLTGIIKLLVVIGAGRMSKENPSSSEDAYRLNECAPDDTDCSSRNVLDLARDAWHARKKMYIKMITTLAVITLIIQVLIKTGFLNRLEQLISPITRMLNLPVEVIGPISTYIFSPTAGITYMSNLLTQTIVTPYQAIVALMAGSLIMIPVTRIRRTLPRYLSIFGMKNGGIICGLTMGLAMLSRIIILLMILIFY